VTVKAWSWQTTGPSLALLVATLITLVVWAVKDPYHWERHVISDENDERGETTGVCTSDNLLAYVIPLVVLMLSATLLAGWMAFKTRDVSEAFSETKWIFYAIFAQIQVWIVSIPIVTLVKRDGSTDVAYLGSVLVVWTFAVTIVVLIIGPRVTQESNQVDSRRSMMTNSSRCFVSGMNWVTGGSNNNLVSHNKAQDSTANSSDNHQRGAAEIHPTPECSPPDIASAPAQEKVEV